MKRTSVSTPLFEEQGALMTWEARIQCMALEGNLVEASVWISIITTRQCTWGDNLFVSVDMNEWVNEWACGAPLEEGLSGLLKSLVGLRATLITKHPWVRHSEKVLGPRTPLEAKRTDGWHSEMVPEFRTPLEEELVALVVKKRMVESRTPLEAKLSEDCHSE